MKAKKKLLIVAPIATYGGRELETGFIAASLSKDYEVRVVSISKYDRQSQIYNFKGFTFTSLNQLVYERHSSVRLVVKMISWLKTKLQQNGSALESPFIKKYAKVESKKHKLIEQLVQQSDVVFVCAQVYSNYMSAVVNGAKYYNKPILFRTTGTIFKDQRLEHLSWVPNVDLFLHHSEANARVLQPLGQKDYRVIDQCAYNEPQLLEYPMTNKRCDTYFVLSRLTEEKQVHAVIEAFLKMQELPVQLHIYGTGSEEFNLKALANGASNIHFYGPVAFEATAAVYEKHDCLIISSSEEAGPLTGVEAMAAAKVVISTKVGAMPQRLQGITDVWYDGSANQLEEKIRTFYEQSPSKIVHLKERIRSSYIKYNSMVTIEQAYIDSVNNCMEI